MQIEKNIAATLQRRMDEAGKTKLESIMDPQRLPQRMLVQNRSIQRILCLI